MNAVQPLIRPRHPNPEPTHSTLTTQYPTETPARRPPPRTPLQLDSSVIAGDHEPMQDSQGDQQSQSNAISDTYGIKCSEDQSDTEQWEQYAKHFGMDVGLEDTQEFEYGCRNTNGEHDHEDAASATFKTFAQPGQQAAKRPLQAPENEVGDIPPISTTDRKAESGRTGAPSLAPSTSAIHSKRKRDPPAFKRLRQTHPQSRLSMPMRGEAGDEDDDTVTPSTRPSKASKLTAHVTATLENATVGGLYRISQTPNSTPRLDLESSEFKSDKTASRSRLSTYPGFDDLSNDDFDDAGSASALKILKADKPASRSRRSKGLNPDDSEEENADGASSVPDADKAANRSRRSKGPNPDDLEEENADGASSVLDVDKPASRVRLDNQDHASLTEDTDDTAIDPPARLRGYAGVALAPHDSLSLAVSVLRANDQTSPSTSLVCPVHLDDHMPRKFATLDSLASHVNQQHNPDADMHSFLRYFTPSTAIALGWPMSSNELDRKFSIFEALGICAVVLDTLNSKLHVPNPLRFQKDNIMPFIRSVLAIFEPSFKHLDLMEAAAREKVESKLENPAQMPCWPFGLVSKDGSNYGFVCVGLGRYTSSHLCKLPDCVLPFHFVFESFTDNKGRDIGNNGGSTPNFCKKHVSPASAPCFPQAIGEVAKIYGQPAKIP
ncbi:hypothetical protein PRZ48_005756 [Zasmidium cellare]|uniref:Uncharacterized protein n=1 Tax=Zasmidium cellare TaxID=395010 RepID=A0ABR0EM21_ZASCE|nr:hypothetical protein PRZ48_005756 [Zasmidium cellare]